MNVHYHATLKSPFWNGAISFAILHLDKGLGGGNVATRSKAFSDDEGGV